MSYVTISAYEVIVAEPVEKDRVSERSIWQGGNMARAKKFARDWTEHSGHSTYVMAGDKLVIKYEWRADKGVIEIMPG